MSLNINNILVWSETPSDDECKEGALFVINELYIINIPSFFFLLCGVINFCKIRSIGFNRVVKYSDLFKFKLYTCVFIIMLNFIKVFLWWYRDASKFSKCFQNNLTWIQNCLKVVQIISWIGAFNLMIY